MVYNTWLFHKLKFAEKYLLTVHNYIFLHIFSFRLCPSACALNLAITFVVKIATCYTTFRKFRNFWLIEMSAHVYVGVISLYKYLYKDIYILINKTFI